jgi:hypothetical protein
MSEGGSMIARRVRHHAGGTLAFREILHSIGGTPELEGPYLLEVLTLEKELRPADCIKLPRGKHRRAVHFRRYQPFG